MELALSLPEWLLASLILLLCAVIQGSIGFGVGLIGAPLLYLVNPQLVPAPVIIVGMILPALILGRDWRSVVATDVGWALPGTLAGTVAGGLVIGLMPASGLSLLFGTLVLLGVGLSSVGWVPPRKPAFLLAGGGLSGFMATTTSIGGPPLALAFQSLHGPRLRGTLSAVFFPGGILALAALFTVDRFSRPELLMGLSLLPSIILGFRLSAHTARWLDRGWLRPALLGLSGAAGATAIGRALLV